MEVVLQASGGLVSAYDEFVVRLVEFTVTFLVLYAVGRFVLEPLFGRALDASGVGLTIERSIRRVVHLVVIVVGLSVAYASAGFGDLLGETGPIIAAVTLAIGFATRDIASNIVSGAFIVSDPKFSIGDWIEWNDTEGIIEDIAFRVTRVRTFDNELVTVPNSQLATSAVTNPVDRETLRISKVFWIGYDDDIGEATDVLLEEARRCDGILDSPRPSVRVMEVNDSRVGLQTRVWIDHPDRAEFVRVRSAYLTSVKERFHERGIDMPPSW